MLNDNSMGLAVEVQNKVNLLFKEIHGYRRDCQYFYAANSVVPLYLIGKIATQEKKSTLLIHQTYLDALKNKSVGEVGFICLNDSVTKNINSVFKNIKNKQRGYGSSFVLLPNSALLLKNLITHTAECKNLLLFIDFDHSSLKKKANHSTIKQGLGRRAGKLALLTRVTQRKLLRLLSNKLFITN